MSINDTTPDAASSFTAIIRGVLSYAGGLLSAKGYLDAATWQALAGAVAPVLAILWSIYERKHRVPHFDRRRRPF